jgi:hypothetical protein
MLYFGSSWEENWYGDKDKNKMERLNQYFMYGISVPYNWYKEWETKTGRSFPVGVYGNIFCLFNGRDGRYIIIGKVLERTDIEDNNPSYMGFKEPLIVPELEEVDKIIIQNSVKEQFGLEGEFHYYFVTQY